MKLFGKEVDKDYIRKHFNNMDAVADARESVLTGGKSEGVRTIDVKTGSGLRFSVLPTRGMDVVCAEYQGIPLSYLSKTGVVHPAYFEKDGLNFLRGFFCGLITTCGLTYMGPPCNDEGTELGLHGRISNTPAESCSVDKSWNGNDYEITVQGKARESSVFGENMTLTRKITTSLGSSSLKVHDVIENEGFKEQPLMVLYHCNFGYPIVSPDSHITISEPYTVKARDEEGEVDKCLVMEEPRTGYNEQVFIHTVDPSRGSCTVKIFNEALKLGVYVKYNPLQLPYMSEWKVMDCDEYVVGIEPSTWTVFGREEARKRNELLFLKPGEKKERDLELVVIDERR